MSSSSEPVHLNNHHRDTLLQIFQHPTSHNIAWRAVVSLLETVGTVDSTFVACCARLDTTQS